MSTPDAADAMRAELDRYREALAALGFDGPHHLGGGLFAREAAVCVGIPDQWLGCGAAVLLGDPDPDHTSADGGQLERGVRLHVYFHRTNTATPDQA